MSLNLKHHKLSLNLKPYKTHTSPKRIREEKTWTLIWNKFKDPSQALE